jgi:hypothetical protein
MIGAGCAAEGSDGGSGPSRCPSHVVGLAAKEGGEAPERWVAGLMDVGVLVADSLVFLESAFVSALAFYLGLARHRSLRWLAALTVVVVLLAVGLALLLDIAVLGMLALAAAVLSVLYVLIALYDFFIVHSDEWAVPPPSEPRPDPQEPDGLRAAVHRAIELLEREDAVEALRVLREGP